MTETTETITSTATLTICTNCAGPNASPPLLTIAVTQTGRTVPALSQHAYCNSTSYMVIPTSTGGSAAPPSGGYSAQISTGTCCNVATGWEGCLANGGAPRAPYMAKTDKERLATGFWNRIESNQATDCNRTTFPGTSSVPFSLTHSRPSSQTERPIQPSNSIKPSYPISESGTLVSPTGQIQYPSGSSAPSCLSTGSIGSHSVMPLSTGPTATVSMASSGTAYSSPPY